MFEPLRCHRSFDKLGAPNKSGAQDSLVPARKGTIPGAPRQERIEQLRKITIVVKRQIRFCQESVVLALDFSTPSNLANNALLLNPAEKMAAVFFMIMLIHSL